jgi:hypothetical protein
MQKRAEATAPARLMLLAPLLRLRALGDDANAIVGDFQEATEDSEPPLASGSIQPKFARSEEREHRGMHRHDADFAVEGGRDE